MVKFLDHINEREEKWLREQAAQESYAPGDVILSEGEERHALFLIRSGVVRVELEHPEFNIEIARLNAGEIFGEMSFLQGFSVTANVIANDKVPGKGATFRSLPPLRTVRESFPSHRSSLSRASDLTRRLS